MPDSKCRTACVNVLSPRPCDRVWLKCVPGCARASRPFHCALGSGGPLTGLTSSPLNDEEEVEVNVEEGEEEDPCCVLAQRLFPVMTIDHSWKMQNKSVLKSCRCRDYFDFSCCCEIFMRQFPGSDGIYFKDDQPGVGSCQESIIGARTATSEILSFLHFRNYFHFFGNSLPKRIYRKGYGDNISTFLFSDRALESSDVAMGHQRMWLETKNK